MWRRQGSGPPSFKTRPAPLFICSILFFFVVNDVAATRGSDARASFQDKSDGRPPFAITHSMLASLFIPSVSDSCSCTEDRIFNARCAFHVLFPAGSRRRMPRAIVDPRVASPCTGVSEQALVAGMDTDTSIPANVAAAGLAARWRNRERETERPSQHASKRHIITTETCCNIG